MVFKNSKNPTPPKKSKRKPTTVQMSERELSDEKKTNRDIPPHFTHQLYLPFPPKRRRRRRRRGNDSSFVAFPLLFFLLSREGKGCERCRTISESRVASRGRERFGCDESFDSAAKGGGLLFAAARRKRAGWTRRERGARQNSGELRGDIRFAR
jgi:hypothetical protein